MLSEGNIIFNVIVDSLRRKRFVGVWNFRVLWVNVFDLIKSVNLGEF